MALEDAAVLEVLLADMSPSETVKSRLRLFLDVRLPRCAATQILSNARFYSSQVDKEKLVRQYYLRFSYQIQLVTLSP